HAFYDTNMRGAHRQVKLRNVVPCTRLCEKFRRCREGASTTSVGSWTGALRPGEEAPGLPCLSQEVGDPRKHLPLKDMAETGGWLDTRSLENCYQQVDEETPDPGHTWWPLRSNLRFWSATFVASRVRA